MAAVRLHLQPERDRDREREPARDQHGRQRSTPPTQQHGERRREQRHDDLQHGQVRATRLMLAAASRGRRDLVQGQDLVLLDAVVGLADAHDEREAERERRDADDDGGQDQHVRQRVRVAA